MLDVFADHLTNDLRRAQIAFDGKSHQKRFIFF